MSNETPNQPPEENLKNSRFLLNHMIERTDRTSLLFNWTIQNYSKLRKNIIYYRSSAGVGTPWSFRLVKARGTLFISLVSKTASRKVHISLISKKKDEMREGSLALEISPGQYVAEFCRRSAEDLRFLEGDELTVQCRYQVKSDEGRILSLPYGRPRDSADMFQLCDDFRELYTKRKFYDFFIECKGKSHATFKVHKAVLIARCGFFSQLFEVDDVDNEFERMSLSILACPLAMNEVLLYLYSGEFRSEDVEVIEVLLIALAFKVTCLVQKCVVLVMSNLTVDNVRQVLRIGSANELVELKNAAVRYMIAHFGRILDVND